MRFKIDRASLTVGSKFKVFALFYFVFEDNFPSTSPRGGLYLEGRISGILRYVVGANFVDPYLLAKICLSLSAN